MNAFEPNYEGSPIVFGPPQALSSAIGSHNYGARAGHHEDLNAPDDDDTQDVKDARNVFVTLAKQWLGVSAVAGTGAASILPVER